MYPAERSMSCNGCRILRKGCNDNCILRQSLHGIETPQAQSNATVFVAKFFGRAGLMSFLSSVPQSQRPALFQSLLFEACGRTVNPVNGAVGLLGTGNWHACQSAVETVLRGGVPSAFPEFGEGSNSDLYGSREMNMSLKRKGSDDETSSIDLGLTARFPPRMTAGGRVKRRRQDSPSEATTFESGYVCLNNENDTKVLRLFF